MGNLIALAFQNITTIARDNGEVVIVPLLNQQVTIEKIGPLDFLDSVVGDKSPYRKLLAMLARSGDNHGQWAGRWANLQVLITYPGELERYIWGPTGKRLLNEFYNRATPDVVMADITQEFVRDWQKKEVPIHHVTDVVPIPVVSMTTTTVEIGEPVTTVTSGILYWRVNCRIGGKFKQIYIGRKLPKDLAGFVADKISRLVRI